MYTIKDNIFSEAGKLLKGDKFEGFVISSNFGPLTEQDLDVTNLSIDENFISFDNIRWINPGIRTYADAKKFIIGKRYSNDDELAIILNKDDSEEDALAYEKMQEWRAWASYFAHKIMEQIENKDV